ncbi:MAG: DNA repair protein RecN [Hyphomonadaceae bacterium]|nr:DNA repair protein RecN [Hyphomonadaceae bacterium]
MLSAISIRNVVLIEALDLELERGFIAMTGETGAGKSIILDALGMATGARSDKGLVRTGADKAQCTASFTLSKHHPAWFFLENAGVEYDVTEDLVLRRIVNKDGRSRAFINDAPASVKLLSQIGNSVLEVHGQHDGRGLLDSQTHRSQLDRFGSLASELASCEVAYNKLEKSMDYVDKLKQKMAKADETREFLEDAISSLDRLAPVPGEDQILAADRRLLQNSEGALSELASAQVALGEDGAYEARIAQALAGLERVKNKIGNSGESAAFKSLSAAGTALEKALIEVEEARMAVATAAEAFEFEPGHLDRVEERLFALRAAARKFDVDIDKLGELRQSYGDELMALENSDDTLKKAIADLAKAEKTYDKAAAKLTTARISAAKKLDKGVVAELPPLKMQKAQFVTRITEAPDSAYGRDLVRFEVSTNPGTPLGPLAKIASGGELSRFALAIKVALSGKEEHVMIFDEVDQGVGGAVADAVGKRLERLSKDGQVLVVTHSPQVAACADHQLLIQKTSKGSKTLTHVEPLSAEQRAEEIARMLAGEIITDAARAAARQLMKAS